MSINAIPTRYAGHHFRSRLEARWAVFFDHLGIRWEYEREGYLCSPRLSHWTDDHQQISYLPDFWFPDHQLHGEVKATMTNNELLRLLDCAASLSSNDGMGCHDNGGSDLVVFGEIPRGETDRMPTALHMHKGDLMASAWRGDRQYKHHPDAQTIARDYGGSIADIIVADDCHEAGMITPARLTQWLTRGSWGSYFYGWDRTWRVWEVAYAAARSARFEHGASGAT